LAFFFFLGVFFSATGPSRKRAFTPQRLTNFETPCALVRNIKGDV
jgi:hypothetical protein